MLKIAVKYKIKTNAGAFHLIITTKQITPFIFRYRRNPYANFRNIIILFNIKIYNYFIFFFHCINQLISNRQCKCMNLVAQCTNSVKTCQRIGIQFPILKMKFSYTAS